MTAYRIYVVEDSVEVKKIDIDITYDNARFLKNDRGHSVEALRWGPIPPLGKIRKFYHSTAARIVCQIIWPKCCVGLVHG